MNAGADALSPLTEGYTHVAQALQALGHRHAPCGLPMPPRPMETR